MKNLFTKAMALICAVTVALSCVTVSSFAQKEADANNGNTLTFSVKEAAQKLSTDASDFHSEQLEKINSDMMVLRAIGVVYNKNQVQEINVESSKVEYTVEIGEFTNVISIEQNKDGSTDIATEQGELHTLVTITSDGTLLIDGKPAGANGKKINLTASLAGYSTTHWSAGPFYGTASSYI